MSTRRVFIKQLSAVAGVGLTASLGVSLHGHAEAALNPAADADEGSRSSGHFAFGAQRAIWGEFTADVQAAQGRIARAIAKFQPVTVFCRERERQLAEATCGSHNVSYVVTELDDIWVRDFGANFVVNGAGELGAVDFNFNGWGNKQRHAKDARGGVCRQPLRCRPTAPQRTDRRRRRYRSGRARHRHHDRKQLGECEP